jgi:hypothetical protein
MSANPRTCILFFAHMARARTARSGRLSCCCCTPSLKMSRMVRMNLLATALPLKLTCTSSALIITTCGTALKAPSATSRTHTSPGCKGRQRTAPPQIGTGRQDNKTAGAARCLTACPGQAPDWPWRMTSMHNLSMHGAGLLCDAG